jgi:type VI protein secretion system component VasK
VETLKACAQDDSPILRVLRSVGDQTQLGADPQSELGKVQNDFAILHEFFEAPQSAGTMKKWMNTVQRLLPRFGGGGAKALDRTKAPTVQYQEQLRAAHEYALPASQPGAPLAELRRLLGAGDEANNPIKQVKAWAQSLAEDSYPNAAGGPPVARVLVLPVENLEQAARGAVLPQEKYRLLVYNMFQRTLAGKYPLVENGPDAPLADFGEFFRPGGTFWSFYESELSPFVMEDGTPRNPEAPLPFSSEFLACLRQAYEIRQAFDWSKGQVPGLNFSVKGIVPRVEGGAVIRRVSLDVGGAPVDYTMGVPQWQAVVWPGTDMNAGAEVRAAASQPPQPESRTSPGPWGLFHLLDQAQLSQIESPTPQVSWTLTAGPSRITVIWDVQPASARHPFRPGFLRFTPPPAL